mgnify:CR=1 FL=1
MYNKCLQEMLTHDFVRKHFLRIFFQMFFFIMWLYSLITCLMYATESSMTIGYGHRQMRDGCAVAAILDG